MLTRFHDSNIDKSFRYDQAVVRNYKQDGVNWTKKKKTDRVQEVHQKINVNGVERITGFYSTSAVDYLFRRRTYRLSTPGSSVFLVHYRKCERYNHAIKTESHLLKASEQYQQEQQSALYCQLSSKVKMEDKNDHSNLSLSRKSLSLEKIAVDNGNDGDYDTPISEDYNPGTIHGLNSRSCLCCDHSNQATGASQFYSNPICDFNQLEMNSTPSFLPESFETVFEDEDFELFSWTSDIDEDLLEGKFVNHY
jgi:hypothetical protein